MKINDLIDFFKEPFERGKTHKAIDKEDTKLLLNYITNLQNENERLKKGENFKFNLRKDKTKTVPTVIKTYKKEYQDYKQRCEKAIEYLLNNKLYMFKYDDEELFEITTDKKAKDDLLNILKGVDEE